MLLTPKNSSCDEYVYFSFSSSFIFCLLGQPFLNPDGSPYRWNPSHQNQMANVIQGQNSQYPGPSQPQQMLPGQQGDAYPMIQYNNQQHRGQAQQLAPSALHHLQQVIVCPFHIDIKISTLGHTHSQSLIYCQGNPLYSRSIILQSLVYREGQITRHLLPSFSFRAQITSLFPSSSLE